MKVPSEIVVGSVIEGKQRWHSFRDGLHEAWIRCEVRGVDKTHITIDLKEEIPGIGRVDGTYRVAFLPGWFRNIETKKVYE